MCPAGGPKGPGRELREELANITLLDGLQLTYRRDHKCVHSKQSKREREITVLPLTPSTRAASSAVTQCARRYPRHCVQYTQYAAVPQYTDTMLLNQTRSFRAIHPSNIFRTTILVHFTTLTALGLHSCLVKSPEFVTYGHTHTSFIPREERR